MAACAAILKRGSIQPSVAARPAVQRAPAVSGFSAQRQGHVY